MKDLMKRWKLANEVIACITTVIIISILPLVFHDYYFDILDTKYYFLLWHSYLHGNSHAAIDSYRSLAK